MRGQTEIEHNGEDAKTSLILPDLAGNRLAKGTSGVQVRLPCMFVGILARNPTRELRIQIDRRARGTTPKRAALRCFREMGTLRRIPVRRTGRIIRPGGKPILSTNGNDNLEGELRHAPTALNAAA